MLPESLISPLQEHLSNVKRLHAQDVMQGVAPVYLPFALERKYPHAGRLLRRERYAQPLDPTSTSTYGSGDGLARFAERVNCTLVSLGATRTLPMPNPVDFRPGHDGSWGLSRGMSPSTTGGMVVNGISKWLVVC